MNFIENVTKEHLSVFTTQTNQYIQTEWVKRLNTAEVCSECARKVCKLALLAVT